MEPIGDQCIQRERNFFRFRLPSFLLGRVGFGHDLRSNEYQSHR